MYRHFYILNFPHESFAMQGNFSLLQVLTKTASDHFIIILAAVKNFLCDILFIAFLLYSFCFVC